MICGNLRCDKSDTTVHPQDLRETVASSYLPQITAEHRVISHDTWYSSRSVGWDQSMIPGPGLPYYNADQLRWLSLNVIGYFNHMIKEPRAQLKELFAVPFDLGAAFSDRIKAPGPQVVSAEKCTENGRECGAGRTCPRCSHICQCNQFLSACITQNKNRTVVWPRADTPQTHTHNSSNSMVSKQNAHWK